MTNKIDFVLKAINDREMGALHSNTVKNPKLNVNVISSVSSPSSRPQYYSDNSMSKCFKQTQIIPKDHETKTSNTDVVDKIIETPPTQNLDDEFKELHLERPVIDVLARAP